MPAFVRKHAATFAIAFITAMVAGGSFVWAHNDPSGGHVTLAHKVTGLNLLPLQKVQTSTTASNDATAREDAQKVKLIEKGPFEVYAKCWRNNVEPSNPVIRAEIYLRTTSGGTIFNSGDSDYSINSFIGPGTEEISRQLLEVASAAGSDPGTVNITDPEAGGFYAAVGSNRLMGDLFAGTKVGSPEAGNGLFGADNDCLFGGTITFR